MKPKAMAMAMAALFAAAPSCGPHKGARTPDGPAPLELEALVVHGEALVATTSMEVLTRSPIGAVLLGGLEQQMAEKAPEMGKALEATRRAPIDGADRILMTTRSLDQDSAILVVGVSYEADVDWFDDFVLAFHEKDGEQATFADLEGGGRLGVLSRDTKETWGTDLTAALCAIKLSERIVAYVAAPDAGECALWAGWVLGRRQGDEELLDKLSMAPKTGGEDPPLAVYADGDELQGLCCAPWGLSEKMYGVVEAWLGLDPGLPTHLSLSVAFSDPGLASERRDALAALLDAYAPFLSGLSPGIAKVLESLALSAEGSVLTASVTIEPAMVEALADILSTML